MYGLETPASDNDIRGCYVHTDLDKAIGLLRYDHQDKRADGDDEFYFEVRHFLNLTRKGNSQCLELLFNDKWLENSAEWQLIVKNRNLLLDSNTIYRCLKGYAQGELRLANGLRAGKIGGKRNEQVKLYNYSPKNFVNLFRILWLGQMFFQHGAFPVNVMSFNPVFGQNLLDVKTNPQNYKVSELNAWAMKLETSLDHAFENRTQHFQFNADVANELCCRLYAPIIESLNKNLKLNL
jgi:predicted nucleotidyltransferase